MTDVTPKFRKSAFLCPNPKCNVVAIMHWTELLRVGYSSNCWSANCNGCGEDSVWWCLSLSEYKGVMIHPDVGLAEAPESDMPEDVKLDYKEASSIANKSPRGAAALLRLGLQKLLKHLGEKGRDINTDIRSLAAKNILPHSVIKVADTIRLTGNNAVHPGEMSEEDIDHVALKMFTLINFIVKKAISEPKELESLYGKTPENKRVAAEAQDAKAKVK
jgi:hypothetical protein